MAGPGQQALLARQACTHSSSPRAIPSANSSVAPARSLSPSPVLAARSKSRKLPTLIRRRASARRDRHLRFVCVSEIYRKARTQPRPLRRGASRTIWPGSLRAYKPSPCADSAQCAPKDLNWSPSGLVYAQCGRGSALSDCSPSASSDTSAVASSTIGAAAIIRASRAASSASVMSLSRFLILLPCLFDYRALQKPTW